MEAEKEQDPFDSIIKLCQPTASQEAKFPNCPLARESENFSDPKPGLFSSSSPDPTPTRDTGIVMISLPDSDTSVEQQVEDDDMVFHTPPEHHVHFNLSSSEDQNLDELCAEGMRDGYDRSKKVRIVEGGLDDEADSKRIRVPGEEFDGGETVPVGETEEIVIKTQGNQDVHSPDVIVIDSADSGEEMDTVNLAEDSPDIINSGVGKIDDVGQKNSELKKVVAPQVVDPIDGYHELGKSYESKPYGSRYSSGSLNSDKIEEETLKLKCIVGNGCIEMGHESGVDGSEKFVKVTKDEKMPKDGGLKTCGKKIQEIDEFRYVGGGGEQRWKRHMPASLKGKEKIVVERVESKSGLLDLLNVVKDGKIDDVGQKNSELKKVVVPQVDPIDGYHHELGKKYESVDGSSRKRQLPESLMKGKEKNVESKSGLLKDLLNVLKVVVGDRDDGGACKDVDFLETAKRRGLTFPRPRWWPPEGDSWHMH